MTYDTVTTFLNETEQLFVTIVAIGTNGTLYPFSPKLGAPFVMFFILTGEDIHHFMYVESLYSVFKT